MSSKSFQVDTKINKKDDKNVCVCGSVIARFERKDNRIKKKIEGTNCQRH